MGFADRDYVKEKAKQRHDDQFHKRTHDPLPPNYWNEATSSSSSDSRKARMARLIIIPVVTVFVIQHFDEISRWAYKQAQALGHAIYAPMTNDLVAKAKEAQDRLKAQAPAAHAPPPKHATLDQRLAAPYIAPMPDSTGYPGMEQQVVMAGNASFVIANAFSSAMFGRLFHVFNGHETPIREFYILGGESITLNRLDDGMYLIRYKDLSSGDNFVSNLNKVGRHGNTTYGGITIRVALSKVNAHRRITDAELNSAGN